MAVALCGCGTMLYGHAFPTGNNSGADPPPLPYIKTEWVTILFVPIWPLASFLVHEVVEKNSAMSVFITGATVDYRMSRLPELHWPQVGRTYIFTALVALFFLWWPSMSDPQERAWTSADLDSICEQASTYFDEEMYDSAAALYGRVARIDTTNLNAQTRRALALAYSGAFMEAIFECNQVLAIDSTDAFAHNALGLINIEMGHNGLAIVEFDRCLELDSSIAAFWANRALAHRLATDYTSAVADYEKAVSLAPEDPDNYFWLAAVSSNLGLTAEAIGYYHTFIEIAPRDDTLGLRIARETIQALEAP